MLETQILQELSPNQKLSQQSWGLSSCSFWRSVGPLSVLSLGRGYCEQIKFTENWENCPRKTEQKGFCGQQEWVSQGIQVSRVAGRGGGQGQTQPPGNPHCSICLHMQGDSTMSSAWECQDNITEVRAPWRRRTYPLLQLPEKDLTLVGA